MSVSESLTLDRDGDGSRRFEPFPDSALEGSVGARFDEIARRHADRPAIDDLSKSVTYRELKLLVDRIAAALAKTVRDRPGPVAILLANDVHYPAAMLGVLAAGRPYVPLDAAHPIERSRAIATHAGAAAVISMGQAMDQARALFASDVPILDLEALPASAQSAPANPGPDDLAQIIYTSGSTGTPKGVVQNHRGLLFTVLQRINAQEIGCQDRVALVYSPTANVGLCNVFSALLSGACLCILSPTNLGPVGLAREIRARRITVLHAVPALLRRLADTLRPDERFDSIRVMRVGGDTGDWSDFDAFRRVSSPGAKFMVGLGTTECSFNQAQWFVDERLRRVGERLPVGRPEPHSKMAIVDEEGREVADGEPGEIVVASRYVSLGYWREPELTQEKFTVDASDPEIRSFKTGDVGIRRPDGLIDFLGRKDHQIKLHGHRIELGDIENALRACSGVRDAAVILRSHETGASRALVAYVELMPSIKGLLPRHIGAALTQKLPQHMRPSVITVLTELPRLPTHKVDRKQLTRLDAERPLASTERSANPVLDGVAKVFESVLEVDGAMPDDNLLSLGGNSLQAVEVALELEKRFGVPVPAEKFQAMQTIRELAGWISSHFQTRREVRQNWERRWEWNAEGEAPFREWNFTDFEISEVSDALTDLKASFRKRQRPNFDSQPLDKWAAAFDFVLLGGRLDLAEYNARALLAAYPDFEYARNVCAFFDRLPPPQKDEAGFRDDATKEVQILAKKSDTTIFIFCDRSNNLGMPLTAAHRWLSQLPANLVYLRDFRRFQFLAGLPSLGTSREATVQALATLAASLGSKHVLCYGNSGGVFSALQYGLELGAEAVLAVAGMTNLSKDFNAQLRSGHVVSGLQETFPGAIADLRALYLAAPRRPRVLASYGEFNWDDRQHAEYLRDIPGVTLRPVENFMGHIVAMELVRRGQFQEHLDWLLGR
jgi:amino acid adenylation domain-containing protein